MKRNAKKSAQGFSRALSAPEIEHLLSHVQAKADAARRSAGSRAVVDELIVLLLLETGLRPRELCGLEIRHTQRPHGLEVPAGRNTRHIPLPQRSAKAIRRYVEVFRRNVGPKAPLILTERGTPLGYISIYNKVQRIGKEAGILDLQPMTLRRTFMVRLFNKEKDLRLVQQQAGHASPKTTARQVRTTCDCCQRVINRDEITRIDSGQVLCGECLKELRP